MAVINKTGITNGGTIQAEHITRAIDALSGGTTDTVIASGSFTGSLIGVVSGSFTGSLIGTATSASFATTASYVASASFATTASYVANASSFPFTGSARITGSLGVTGSIFISGSTTTSGSAIITGSMLVTGSLNTTGTLNVNGSTVLSSSIALTGSLTMLTNIKAAKGAIVDFSAMAGAGSAGKFVIPTGQTEGNLVAGTIFWDDATQVLYIWSATAGVWTGVQLA